MVIRPITCGDAESFFNMMCFLDDETPFMMYEPGERVRKITDISGLRNKIDDALSGNDLLLVAEDGNKEIAGYIWAERGRLNRILHTAYIVVGIRESYRRQGIGTEFFKRLDEWARRNGIVRLELTVECANVAGIKLYEKNGFVVEGKRIKSMKLNGEFVDEFYMAKLLLSASEAENNDLIENLDALHTTELGVMRIKRNLSLDTDDVVDWCKAKINSADAVITRKGKNWYVNVDNCFITVNAYSYTIITAHEKVARKIK